MYSHTNLFTYGLCPQESNNNFYNQQWTIWGAETWVYVPCNNRDELVASQNCRWKQLVSLQYRPWKSIFDLLIWSIYYNFKAAAQLTADEEFGGTALQETVDVAYRETSKRLLEIFFSKYKFLDHLRVRNVLRPFFNYFFSVGVVVLVVVVVSQRL